MEDIILMFFKNAHDLLDQLLVAARKTLKSVLQTCDIVHPFDDFVVAVVESFVPNLILLGYIFGIDKWWCEVFDQYPV